MRSLTKKYLDVANTYLGKLKHLVDTSESNISLHIIEPILIEKLLFKKEWLSKEERSENSQKHFDIKINDALGHKLIIECKRANKKLTNEHIEQITGYLNSQTTEWGILTNGFEWMLINNLLERTKNIYDKVVFYIDLRKQKGKASPENLIYFSSDFLFSNNILSNYYKLIQQFRVYKQFKDNSWSQYNSTLILFTKFLMYKNSNQYIMMDTIRENEIIEFFKWYAFQESHKKKNKEIIEGKISVETAKNLFNFINSFYRTMYENEKFRLNPMYNIKFDVIKNKLNNIILSSVDELEIDIEIITENLQMVVEYMDSNHRDSERNKLILYLFLYGLGREEIANIKLADIEKSKLKINSNGITRNFTLTEKMVNLVSEYLKYRKEKNVKSIWLICKTNGEKMHENSISDIVNDVFKMSKSKLSIEKIQQYVIKEFVMKCKDLFNLLYTTGLDVSSLGRFVDIRDIEKNGKSEKLILHNHPLREFIE